MDDRDETLLLERMTWPEIERAMEAGMTTVIVPAGAIEQHGPHLPLLTDTAHATRLGLEIARRLGNALVAPTIRPGCSDHHLAFAGTITLRAETFSAVCEDYTTSLAHHGFTRLCFFSGHGGNFRVLGEIEARLNELAGAGCEVFTFSDLEAFLDIWRNTIDEYTGLRARVGGHADIAESSVMLALAPETVRQDEVAAGYEGRVDREFLNHAFKAGFRSVTPNGIMGDAHGMSEELGAVCIERMADMFSAAFASR